MQQRWFKELGWLYRPASWQGMLVTVALILFCWQVFVAVDSKSHSVSDTLYGIFPFWAPALLFWLWLAAKSSAKGNCEVSRTTDN